MPLSFSENIYPPPYFTSDCVPHNVLTLIGKNIFPIYNIKMPSPTHNAALEKLDIIVLASQMGIITPLTY